MQELETIKKQSQLEMLGLTYDDIMNGEVAALEPIELKVAKKQKEPIVKLSDVDAIILAYHTDLVDVYKTLESLSTSLKSITEEVNEKDAQISSLSTQLTSLTDVENKIEYVNSICETIERSLVSLKEAKETNDKKIDELNHQLDEKQTHVNALNASINTIQSEKDNAQSELENMKLEKEKILTDLSNKVQIVLDEFYEKIQ